MSAVYAAASRFCRAIAPRRRELPSDSASELGALLADPAGLSPEQAVRLHHLLGTVYAPSPPAAQPSDSSAMQAAFRAFGGREVVLAVRAAHEVLGGVLEGRVLTVEDFADPRTIADLLHCAGADVTEEELDADRAWNSYMAELGDLPSWPEPGQEQARELAAVGLPPAAAGDEEDPEDEPGPGKLPERVRMAADQIIELRSQLEQVGEELSRAESGDATHILRLERQRFMDGRETARHVIDEHKAALRSAREGLIAEVRRAGGSDALDDAARADLRGRDDEITRAHLALDGLGSYAEQALTPRARTHREAVLAEVRRLREMIPGVRFVPLHWVRPIDGDGGVTRLGCTCSKGLACGSPGKHPIDAGWPDAATGDMGVIAQRWGGHDDGPPRTTWGRSTDGSVTSHTEPGSTPLANLAVACDSVLGLDIDARNGGMETLARLEKQLGPLPHSVRGPSPRGGLHILFPHPGGRLKCSLGPGFEVKWTGGHLITIPPSRSAHGQYGAMDGELEELPAAWQDFLRHRERPERTPGEVSPVPADGGHWAVRYVLVGIGREAEALAARRAERHHGVFEFGLKAGSLLGALAASGVDAPPGADEDGVLGLAHEACTANGYVHKVGIGEIDRTCCAGFAAGQANPRELPSEVVAVTGAEEPTIKRAILYVEATHDLRPTSNGEFAARPADP